MKAIVLAAGFATRLYPLTRDRAKPLLDVGGRPVLSWLLDRVTALEDLTEIVVVINDKFHDQFRAWREGYRAELPLRLVCDGAISESEKLGGLGDLSLAWASLSGSEPVFVVAGDNLLDFDLEPFQRAFVALGQPLVFMRRIEGALPPRRYGELVVDEDGRIASFREKPPDPRSRLTATCTYFFPPAVRGLLQEDPLSSGGHRDAPGHFLEWLVRLVPTHARLITGRWFDIGNLQTLEEARAAFSD